MRDQTQPFRFSVQFGPAAHIPLTGLDEIDEALKFMGPVFPRRDCAISPIDLNEEPGGIMGSRVKSSLPMYPANMAIWEGAFSFASSGVSLGD